jgi:hypothetical protein
MKKFLKIAKIIFLFIKLPIDSANGSNKKTSLKIKKLMISARLL